MANMLKMMKQVQQVRKMQKELAGRIVEVSSNDHKVTVVARGDMTVKTVKIDPEIMGQWDAERLGKVVTSTINGALDAAKKAAASDMAKFSGGLGGLSDMLG